MFHTGCFKCYIPVEGVPLVRMVLVSSILFCGVPRSALYPLIHGAVALHSQPSGCLLPVFCKHNPLFPCFVKEPDRDLGTFAAFVCVGLGLQCLNGTLPFSCGKVLLFGSKPGAYWRVLFLVIMLNHKWLYELLCECVFLSVGIFFQRNVY